MNIYDTLNDKQKEAVFHTEGPLLILAGAGSGKTRVLTHRIAYLIEEKGVNPWNILAITFTNKAAAEMRERVDNLVGFGSESIWVSTFHSMCVRILRRHIALLGYDTNFTIYDTDDQKKVVKGIMKQLVIKNKDLTEGKIVSRISKLKEDGMSVRNLIRQSNVKLICTTDDPVDDLKWHEVLAADDTFEVQVLPAWRPDKAMNLEKSEYADYIAQLSKVSGVEIKTFEDLKEALNIRLD